ncbi:MAG: hypothetical protein E5X34_13240 [Mesorhizobium sp.]|uniref:hypothetical protein n=1 Tax=Mesorhizobium sp. TaxID=1871066 RepID=UPI0011F93C09|nr:hypothetical protein [Mesorhizobium sp.]TIR24014.1 MAG: hypothetical protein E5X34_13240 [Mesorhizobium sp.]
MLKAFVFLATVYTSHGPVVYVMDSRLTGEDCISRMEAGLTAADMQAVQLGRVQPDGMGDVPPVAPDLAGGVLSCEVDDYDD